MGLDLLREFFFWCFLINYGVLVLWFGMFVFARNWLRAVHGRWFRIPEEHFDAIHYAMMGIFKLGILFFNLVPWIVLRILV